MTSPDLAHSCCCPTTLNPFKLPEAQSPIHTHCRLISLGLIRQQLEIEKLARSASIRLSILVTKKRNSNRELNDSVEVVRGALLLIESIQSFSCKQCYKKKNL